MPKTLPVDEDEGGFETRHYRIGDTVNMCRIRTPKTPPVDEAEGGFKTRHYRIGGTVNMCRIRRLATA